MGKIQLMNVQRQHETYAEEYEEAALKVMRGGTYIGGEEVSEFEKEFAEYYGAKYGISCGNGTDALVLALRALGIGQGDEVITVSFTFFATAESISAVGATPVFIDVCKDTYCMNPNLIETAITENTKAILPVHFYGHAADMDAIKKIAQKHKLYVIADCAQSTGTKYKNKRSNTLGDISCFSFFPTKNLGANGDGGMILTDDKTIARACQSLKVHGSGADGLDTLKKLYISKGKRFPENMPVGESKYYNYLIGYNSRLDAIQAAILRRKLLHLDEFIEKRRENAALYNKALEDTTYITPYESHDCFHSYYLYVLAHESAQMIMNDLRDSGIGCGVYYPVPLHLQEAFSELLYKEGDLPITENLAKTTFAIPIFPELLDEERKFIIKILKKAERKVRGDLI